MRWSSVGLVLRVNAVEVVTARRTLKGVRVLQIVSEPIRGEEEGDVVSAIRTALERANVKARSVAVSLPPQDVLLRSFTLPRLPRPEWQNAVAFEVRKYIPFRTDELVWGFRVVEQPSAKSLEVTFVGVRAERFVQIEKWLAAAGIKPSCVEAQAVSLTRLAAQILKVPKPLARPSFRLRRGATPQPAASYVGIVDVAPEGESAHLIIARRVPCFAREVTLNGAAIPAGTQPGADPRAEALLSELRLSCDFVTRRNPQATIDKLVLFGDPTIIGPWVSWLEEHLSYPVTLGRPPVGVEQREGARLEYAAAVGLALRQLRVGIVNIDLLIRRSEQPAAKARAVGLPAGLDLELAKRLIKPVAVQVAVALVALGLLAGFWNRRVAVLRDRVAQTIAAFPDVGWGLQGKTDEELQQLSQTLDQRLSLLRTIMGNRISVTEKLDALARALPDGVWLDGLQYQDRLERTGANQTALTLRGSCFLPDRGDGLGVINEFVQRIRQDEAFFRGFTVAQVGEIKAAEDQTQRYTYRTFRLNFQTERGVF